MAASTLLSDETPSGAPVIERAELTTEKHPSAP